MSPQLVQQVELALREMESWRGEVLLVEESLSRDCDLPRPHDRHFATLSRFPLRLENVGWAISGSSITLDGNSDGHPSFYQIAMDIVVFVDMSETERIIFVERFEQRTERRSILRVSRHSEVA
jgi:hypothetical protein